MIVKHSKVMQVTCKYQVIQIPKIKDSGPVKGLWVFIFLNLGLTLLLTHFIIHITLGSFLLAEEISAY